MKVLALIADIVSSRTAKERAAFQRGLDERFQEINALSCGSLASPFTITLGDEVQAVYRNPDSLFRDIMRIVTFAYPYRTRFALALGALSTDLNPKAAIGMDGPSFAAARQLLGKLKRESRTIIQLAFAGQPSPALANICFSLLPNELEGWGRNTMSILSRMVEGARVGPLASEVQITERAVYKNIRANHLADYVEMMDAIVRELQAGMMRTAENQ